MEHPLVSVVIPTYNRAGLVVDALESVEAQTYRPLEVLVVDDGSADDTVEVVERWLASRLREGFQGACLVQENQGGNVARNTGISAATGELVAFLDSDDCWHPEKIALQVQKMQQAPEVGAVYCGVRHVDAESGEALGTGRRQYATGDLLALLLVSDVTAPTSTFMVRRQAFAEVGQFDVGLRARQDWDMWIRVASRFQIGAVPLPLVDFRDHSGPRTASDPSRELDGYIRIREKYRELLAAQGPLVRLAARSAFLKRRGRVLHHHGISWWRAVGCLAQAAILWPLDFDVWAALVGAFLPGTHRRSIHEAWNRMFAGTRWGIRSH